MKRRGSRLIDPDRLWSVTPDARHKTRFVIVGAVGVCEGDKSAPKPLDRKPSVSMKQILKQVSMGAVHPDVTSTLAARLPRIAGRRKQAWHDEFGKASGSSLAKVAKQLLESTDPDRIATAVYPLPADTNMATGELEAASLAAESPTTLHQEASGRASVALV